MLLLNVFFFPCPLFPQELLLSFFHFHFFFLFRSSRPDNIAHEFAFQGWVRNLLKAAEETPYLYVLFTAVIGLPIIIIVRCCVGGGEAEPIRGEESESDTPSAGAHAAPTSKKEEQASAQLPDASGESEEKATLDVAAAASVAPSVAAAASVAPVPASTAPEAVGDQPAEAADSATSAAEEEGIARVTRAKVKGAKKTASGSSDAGDEKPEPAAVILFFI